MVAALIEVTGVTNVLKNAGGRTRGLEGLDDVSPEGEFAGGSCEVPTNEKSSTEASS